MSDEVIVSRNVPIPSGRQLAENSLSVTFASDQPAIPIISGADMPSETGTSMFGFQVTEQRQFLLQELPTYGINSSIWTNRGNVVYDPSRSCVEMSLSGEANQLSTHQSAFAYKYQPGKEICTSQAVQAQIGPIAQNVIQQWGEFTKRDGYGWRVLTQEGTSVSSGSNTVTPWHNYLCFFRRTSAIPENYTTVNVTSDPTGINSGGSSPILLGTGSPNTLYRPAYLVGSGTDTTYIESNVWEDIVFTTLKSGADSNQVFNRDRLTNLDGDGKIPIDGGNRENSAKEISAISLSFSINNVTASTGNTLSIPFNPTDAFGAKVPAKSLATGWIRPGMSLRIEGDPTYSGFITSIAGNTLTVSPAIPSLLNATIYINELANLCMFLIQRSWYGGAGGKGLVYIPDRNPPFVGSTRWVSAHETRIGDTLPVPSMSNPDQPITYQIGRFATAPQVSLTPKLRRFGVSVWINGGDPRPVIIESAGSGSPKSVSNTAYTPIMAIAVKPFVWNNAISAERPQKSRVYPYKLYASSGGNPCEIYLSKISNLTNSPGLLGIPNTTWYAEKLFKDDLKVVASLNVFTGATIINAVDGYPTNLPGKQIGPFYCGTNEGIELDLTDIFDPQRELLGRAENVLTGNPGDVLLLVARCLNSTSGQTSNVAISLVYGVQ